MKLKSTLFSVLAVACLCFTSCSKEKVADKLTGGCYSFLDEYESVTAASAAFNKNPTTENCEAYKSAWINFYKSFKDCKYWEDGTYEETLNEIKNMDCSSL